VPVSGSWLLVLVLAVLAAPAAAAIPYPPNCSVDPVLVGDSSGMPIGNGFRVVAKDAAGQAIAGVTVTLQFFGAVHPYTMQVAPAVVTCPFVLKTTDATGTAVFNVRFGGFSNAAAVLVRVDGVVVSFVPARSTDIDGDGLTWAFDLNLFRSRFLNNPQAPETDFDGSGVTDLADFAIFRQVYLHEIPGVPCP